ncbi:MAG TPA: molybdopterin cofactor-binding domain-containing protein [Aggregatilineaceae bacterium]|nr:molybdopterin cofactor-binding domain-containing protein [Aggregatilineaceae bacterium]
MTEKSTGPARPTGGNPPRRGSGRAEAFFGRLTQRLDDWLAIQEDGTIIARSGKVELGTGTRTALAQIVAEELDVPFERVHVIMGDTAQTPDEGYTAGSMTVNASGGALRGAAAEARWVLLDMASAELDASIDEMMVRDGVISVSHHPDRTITYAQLMGGKLFNRDVSGSAPVKRPETYRIVGTSTPREDIPRKVTGQPSFVQDLRVPGMLHARLVRPPSAGAKLVAVDEGSVADLPGLVRVVKHGNFIGVVAEREEQAVLAAKQLKVEWRETAVLPAMDDLYTSLRAQPTDDTVLIDQGDIEAAYRGAAQQRQATYYQPYHAHASIGPSCAVADVRDDQITLWGSTAGPNPVRGAIAQFLEVPVEKIRFIHTDGAGSYGQNGADDVAADAALLSRAVGRPVRVQWSREEEFIWEPKAPAMVMDVRAGLNSQGSVVMWDYHVWSPSHVARPRLGNELLAAQLWLGQDTPPPRFSFGAERNAPTNYTFPTQRVTVHWLSYSPLRASAFRSLGGAENTFANESFMDELAAAAGADPVEFRLRHLADPRAHDVLKAAADKADWDTRPAPRTRHTGQAGMVEGRGVAYAQYENDQALVACIAYVRVDLASGAVRVDRIVVAHDCGLIINPDGVKNQIEGNVIQSLSRALKEEVKFDSRHVTSVDWDSYPILTFSEVPDVEIVLINRPDLPAVGAGEPSMVTTAAAVANAIFDATGGRVRQIPFSPERVRAALP